MSELHEQVNRFLNKPLPPEMSAQLLSTVEAAGLLRGGLVLSSSAKLLCAALQAAELHCAAILRGSENTLRDIIIGMASSNHRNTTAQQMNAYRRCHTYFGTKMQSYGFIPATDIFRAHKYFTTYNDRCLSDPEFANAYDLCASEINAFLEAVFTSPQEHHLFIRIALLYVCLRFYETCPIDALVLDTYFMCLLHKENLPVLPICVSRYELLNEPYEGQNRYLAINQQVMDFLIHLEEMFVCASSLLQRCETEAHLMRAELPQIIPATSVSGIMDVLINMPAFHNHDLERSANLSNKTAIRYIRKLHDHGYIDSAKIGRETIHIKKQMLFYLEEGTFYGTKEP